MEYTRRRLPHIYREGRPLFVTWHLYGSIPNGRYPPPEKLNSGAAFVWLDRYVDTVRTGPMALGNAVIAQLVVNTLRRGVELGQLDLHAWCIMRNHVHVLLTPRIDPTRLFQLPKGLIARDANKVLGLTGQHFWQRESYDHWVRNDEEFSRIVRYIENNPVKAGLVSRPSDYRWSSAYVDTIVDAAP